MPCQRCQGLMIEDHFIDMEEGGRHLWLCAWRCLNCGDVVDSAIMRNRLGFDKRSPRTSPRKFEVIAVGI